MGPTSRKADNPVSDATIAPPGDSQDRYEGFSLRSVTWGYRDIFEKTIEELFRQGLLGEQRREVTTRFFDLLKRSDQSCFDHVLRQFIGALNPRTRWIMNLPAIFSDVVETGSALAEGRLYNGMRFFETLAAGGMGASPESIRECLTLFRRLRELDDDLAMAFLSGYERLSSRLRSQEMQRYIDVAIEIYQGNKDCGCSFLRGELNTSETYILAITHECRLSDVSEAVRGMIAALTGRECEIAGLGRLDSDELIERGAMMLAIEGHVYLPERFRRFDSAVENRRWYILCGIISAAMLMESSFALIHGHPRHSDCTSLTGSEPWRINLFLVMEYVRVLRCARRRWPGARRMIKWGISTELARGGAADGAMTLFADALDESCVNPVVEKFRAIADDCVNCYDTAARLDKSWTDEILAAYPSLRARVLSPMGFLSDFLFPLNMSDPPSDQMIADLKDAAFSLRERTHEREQLPAVNKSLNAGNDQVEENDESAGTLEAAFLYDEWDFQQNDYRANWCIVHEKAVEPESAAVPDPALMKDVRKIKAVFEHLKPEIVRREKRLADGDSINTDLLLRHIVDRTREPSPPARFYEKPMVNHRDLGVLVLLDVSGSTGAQSGDAARVLDIEIQAAILLGYGLAALDDRFAICGFSSSGREKCEFFVFKNFDDDWGGPAIGRIMAAWPRSSTRIGPALRHSGHMLSLHPNRQRLILLVTDGQPMDEGYDHVSRYAQHDVRMACEENSRQGIHTFAFSTEENSLADMEIMFPGRRFAIMPDISRLPVMLPRLFINMTTR